ncbi:MAG: SIS domain-containing protein [Armatimonadota bacterium]|nr:SIS domain-containing protein [Armatimonadota bacterium]MDR7436954.1 SIS domain-containing protein [Armatimonadota bacterium]MDR7472272.1 SIS domain-containing protein [Armatimonadota bacterium]MDR7506769.1 SIS domain-containing protein [Armatimonadota bacterium]MDR7508360.1 SIS domain-containing protein [Armatimonadota bacterium]
MTARRPPGGWMLREIREQPDVFARLARREGGTLAALGARLRRRPPPLVILAARGTSDNAALYGRYLIETRLGIPVSLAAPSVVTLYGRRLRVRGALVVGLSQSGRSVDVVEFVRAARSAGALTVALTNDTRSPLARAAHEVVGLQAGPERSVAATKTYTAQLMCLSLLVAHAAADRVLLRAHGELPDLAARSLGTEPAVEEVAHHLARAGECIVTSRGYNFATALEAALKLKEGARVVAEALSSADLLHGPIAVVRRGFPVLVIAPPGRVAAHLRGVLRRLRARRARTVVLSSEAALLAEGTQAVALPPVSEEALTPHVYILPLQLLAYHVARRRGLDPDRPRGLRKVTAVL